MPRVLVTAFGPYGSWKSNASWLALTELTRELPVLPQITTRLYSADFSALRQALEKDLQTDFDYTLHLGQAPGSTKIRLESIALNVAGTADPHADEAALLCEDGPLAYRSRLPLSDWAAELRQAGIPAKVSVHAGSYLCNATLYLVHYLLARVGKPAHSTFIHLPLAVEQVVGSEKDLPCLPRATAAQAIRIILEQLKSVRDRDPIA